MSTGRHSLGLIGVVSDSAFCVFLGPVPHLTEYICANKLSPWSFLNVASTCMPVIEVFPPLKTWPVTETACPDVTSRMSWKCTWS